MWKGGRKHGYPWKYSRIFLKGLESQGSGSKLSQFLFVRYCWEASRCMPRKLFSLRQRSSDAFTWRDVYSPPKRGDFQEREVRVNSTITEWSLFLLLWRRQKRESCLSSSLWVVSTFYPRYTYTIYTRRSSSSRTVIIIREKPIGSIQMQRNRYAQMARLRYRLRLVVFARSRSSVHLLYLTRS